MLHSIIIVIDENNLLSQYQKNILPYVLLSNTINFARKRKRYVKHFLQVPSYQLIKTRYINGRTLN